MEALQIAGIGITSVLFAVWLKNYNASYSICIASVACIIIFYFSISRLHSVFMAVEQIESYIQVNGIYLTVLIKIIGITYIAEFSAALCKDAGFGAVAAQIETFGKLSILAVSMPVFLALLETIDRLL